LIRQKPSQKQLALAPQLSHGQARWQFQLSPLEKHCKMIRFLRFGRWIHQTQETRTFINTSHFIYGRPGRLDCLKAKPKKAISGLQDLADSKSSEQQLAMCFIGQIFALAFLSCIKYGMADSREHAATN